MPLYEYRCKECGTISEFLSGVGETGQEPACNSCGSLELDKIMSAANVSTYPAPKGGKTCCGLDERCGNPKGCCGR